MVSDPKSNNYEKIQELAEQGQHTEALELVKEHLKNQPEDAQAWNDSGAILYCLGRNQEAITHFEKAKAFCGDSESAEIYWNLCEAYVENGFPSQAVKLFDAMERMKILNCDAVNRVANAFVQQGYYGNAVETLLRSLKLLGNQEILLPMLEILRTKRPKVAFSPRQGAEESETDGVFGFIKQRFLSESFADEPVEKMRSIMDWCDIAWFEGCHERTVELLDGPKVCKVVMRLSDEDIYEQDLDNIDWDDVDVVITTNNPLAREILLEKVSDIEKRTELVGIARGVNIDRFEFRDRQRGKRLAWIGNISAKANPMLLLQCMQKLHYVDPDYRLCIAGESKDKTIEQYLRHTVEALGLSDVVVFGDIPKNMNTWLRDKHYIVSTSIDGSGLAGVLKGMSCGLKPVVHNFAGVDGHLDKEFVFDIAEDFCEQITSDSFEPARYREIVETGYSQETEMKAANEVLYRIEKSIEEDECKKAKVATAVPDSKVVVQDFVGQSKQRRVPGSKVVSSNEVGKAKTDKKEQVGSKVFPIKPIIPPELIPGQKTVASQESGTDGNLGININTSVPNAGAGKGYGEISVGKSAPTKPIKTEASETGNGAALGAPPNIRRTDLFVGNSTPMRPVPMDVPKASSVNRAGSIAQMAAEVMRATQALSDQSDKNSTASNLESWEEAGTNEANVSRMTSGSVEASARENQIARMASEFSEEVGKSRDKVKRVKVNQVPFVS